ncbi:MAG: tyrosine-type recombinase/integrase [Caldimonas sp.]
MARVARPLTAAEVACLSAPGLHAVGTVPGLYLRVLPPPSSAKMWALKVVVDGRRHELGLGGYPAMSLTQAIASAEARRQAALAGRDAVVVRRKAEDAARSAPMKPVTFAQAAEAYISTHTGGWKHPLHASQWRRSLELHAHPSIGELDVLAIGIAEVLSVLEPIWRTKTETASKVRARIELILSWAYKRAETDRLNPARWVGHLDTQLPARGKIAIPRHHTALPFAEMPRFMKALDKLDGGGARALEFAILTAARPGEARLARWPEIDFASRTWIVPAARMKAGREHRVPLSSAAIALLESTAMVDGSDVIFQSTQGGGGEVSDMTLTMVCRRMGENCVPHGFRSTFRDWCAECTDAAPEVAEMALAHQVGNAVEAAYRRGDLLEKRRALMEAWSTFLATGATAPALKLSGPRRVPRS